jgi:hypothetical protein
MPSRRRWLLLTYIHVDTAGRERWDRDAMVDHLIEFFERPTAGSDRNGGRRGRRRAAISVERIIAVTEEHKCARDGEDDIGHASDTKEDGGDQANDHGLHYHIGIQLAPPGADGRYLTRQLRAFHDKIYTGEDGQPLYGGRAFNLNYTFRSFHPIVQYCAKEDQSPFTGGSDDWTIEQVLADGPPQRLGSTQICVEDLRGRAWRGNADSVVETFFIPALRHYSNLYRLWNDINFIGDRRSPGDLLRDCIARVPDGTVVDAYTLPETGLDWMRAFRWLKWWLIDNYHPFDEKVYNFKQPQVFLVGPPGTGKTSFCMCLEEMGLVPYQPPNRIKDWTGWANNTFHFVMWDEFNIKNVNFDELKQFLQGSHLKLDMKYSPLEKKLENLPIIMMANYRPAFDQEYDRLAFEVRTETIDITRRMGAAWDPARLAVTLLGDIPEIDNLPIRF